MRKFAVMFVLLSIICALPTQMSGSAIADSARLTSAASYVQATYTPETGVVAINGKLTEADRHEVLLTIVAQDGKLEYTNQKKTDEDGSFAFSYRMQKPVKGTYQVKAIPAGRNFALAEQPVIGAQTSFICNEPVRPPDPVDPTSPPASGTGESRSPASPSGAVDPKLEWTVHPDGSVKLLGKPTAIKAPGAGSTARFAVNAQALQKGFALAKAADDASAVAIIELLPVNGASSYTLELPAAFFGNGSLSRYVRFVTPLGVAVLPDHMLLPASFHDGSTFMVTIGYRDIAADETGKPLVYSSFGENVKRMYFVQAAIDGKPLTWNNPGAPVKLMLPFVASKAQLANPEHVIVRSVEATEAVKTIAMSDFDPQSGYVSFAVTSFAQYIPAYFVKSFNDLEQVEWARKQIEALASRDVIAGTSAGIFEPDAPIKRADFLLLLIRLLDLHASAESNFADVRDNDYFSAAVGTAKKLGITHGVGSNAFKPNDPIRREDMMVLTVRALRALGKLQTAAYDANLTESFQAFSDAQDVSAYAVDSASTLVAVGIVHGSGNRLRPGGLLTRAEAASIVYGVKKALE